MDSPGTSSQASTPTMKRRILVHGEEIVFRYRWPVRVSQRVINADTGDRIILNISQPFCTSYNGVLFTWTLRLHDDYAVNESGGYDGDATQVNVSLYFKDGPKTDVTLNGVYVSVADSEERTVYSNLRIGGEEWTKGSGWPVQHGEVAGKIFSDFVRDQVGKMVYITADLRMQMSDFQPLQYLPSLDAPSATLELMAMRLVQDLADKKVAVPDTDELEIDPVTDSYPLHRRIYLYACDEITTRFNETSYSGKLNPKTIQNIVAHIYFEKMIAPDVRCIEDLCDVLDGIMGAHIPALKRESERFICNRVLQEELEPGLRYVKKALLLATRYDLTIVKMMASGIILDRFNIDDDAIDFRQELAEVAVHLPFRSIPSMSDEDDSSADEMLVGSVVDQLQLLSRRMRRVSISPCQSISAPSTPLAQNDVGRPRTGSTTPSTSSNSSTEPHADLQKVRSTKIGRFHSEILVHGGKSSSSSETSPTVITPTPVFRTTPRRMQKIIIAEYDESSSILDTVFAEENLILHPDDQDQVTIGRNSFMILP